jgi:hypothetical protein
MDDSVAHSASNADPMSLLKRNHDMMLPLKRVARSYEALIGQAIGTAVLANPDVTARLHPGSTIFEDAG